MDRQKKLKIALPILGVVMAVVWGPVILGGGSKQKEEKSVKNAGASVSTQGSDMDLMVLARSGKRKAVKTFYVDWKRNPFEIVQDPNSLVIEGIVWSEENPKAIINGSIVAVGDRIGSNEVIDIKQNSVTIRSGTEEIELHMGAVK